MAVKLGQGWLGTLGDWSYRTALQGSPWARTSPATCCSLTTLALIKRQRVPCLAGRHGRDCQGIRQILTNRRGGWRIGLVGDEEPTTAPTSRYGSEHRNAAGFGLPVACSADLRPQVDRPGVAEQDSAKTCDAFDSESVFTSYLPQCEQSTDWYNMRLCEAVRWGSVNSAPRWLPHGPCPAE